MKCIFCKSDTLSSKSEEHIIPESLGNKSIILPKGCVCDKCNNYFSLKIEKIILDEPYFISLRHRHLIYSKRNKSIPQTYFLLENAGYKIDAKLIQANNDYFFSIENTSMFEAIKNSKTKRLISILYPMPQIPNRLMSRFLIKCALEYILFISKEDDNYLSSSEYLTNHSGFDALRDYARYDKGAFWEYSQRIIYPEYTTFKDKDDLNRYQVLHEMKLFYTDKESDRNGNTLLELYFILVIMGVEYVICVSDRNISGYSEWLKTRNYISPIFDN